MDEETGEVRRKSASEFEDLRSQDELGAMPGSNPEMRRAATDPLHGHTAGNASLQNDMHRISINEEVCAAIFGGFDGDDEASPASATARTTSTDDPLMLLRQQAETLTLAQLQQQQERPEPRPLITQPRPAAPQPTGQSTHASMARDEHHCGICWDDLTPIQVYTYTCYARLSPKIL
jgi:hypothetical protein